MKRYALLILVVMLVSVFFAKTTVVHWMHHSPARAEIVGNLADEFMKANPDIEIVVQTIPEGEYKTKLLAAVAAGSGPDVAQVPARSMTELLDYGIISEFPSKVVTTQYMKDYFMPATIESLIINNKLYGIPTDVQTIMLFYNTNLFKAAGIKEPPKDWNELREYAIKLAKWEGDKMVQAGLGIEGYHPVIETFMVMNGATFTDPKNSNRIVVEDAQVQAMKFLTDLVVKDKVYTRKFGARYTMFRQNVEGMVFGHGAMLGSLQVGAVPELEFKVAPVPKNPVTGEQKTVLTSWALVIMDSCKNKEAAAKWLMYVSSENAQKQWIKTGELPSLKSVINDKEIRKDERLAVILDSLNYAVPTKSKGWADPFSKFRDIGFNEVVNKGADPKKVVENAVLEINKYLAETFN